MQALAKQVGAFTAAMQQAMAAQAGHSDPAVLDLDSIQGLPLMPTMNGWLLGYPVIYLLADAEEAALASRALSSSALLLHRVMLACREPLIVAPQGLSRAGQADVLCAFSLPEELLGSCVEARVGLWLDDVRDAAADWAIWDVPEMDRASVGPGPVAL